MLNVLLLRDFVTDLQNEINKKNETISGESCFVALGTIFNFAKRERVLFIWENAPVFINSWILVRREHSVHFGECAEVAFWCIALRRHWRWCGHGRTQGADSQ